MGLYVDTEYLADGQLGDVGFDVEGDLIDFGIWLSGGPFLSGVILAFGGLGLVDMWNWVYFLIWICNVESGKGLGLTEIVILEGLFE